MFWLLAAGLMLLQVLPLLLIFGDLIHKGASSIDWNFFVKSPVPAGEAGGGVANAIVGTLELIGLASLIGVPIGIGSGLYLAAHYLREGGPLASAAVSFGGGDRLVMDAVSYWREPTGRGCVGGESDHACSG